MKTTAQRVLMSTKAKSEAPKDTEDNKQEVSKRASEQDQKESENEQNAAERKCDDVNKDKPPLQKKESVDSGELPSWNFDISNLLDRSDSDEKDKIQSDEPIKAEPIKAVVFDFDQTISVIHFFSDLRGYTPDMQLRCLNEWSKEKVLYGFGGEERLQLLVSLLKDLRAAKVEIYILSFGYKEVITEALERVNLLMYFDKNLIWGAAEVKRFRSDTGIPSQTKQRMIQKLIREKHNYSPGEVLFVDDDYRNLEQSNKTVCKTIHVSERQGMTKKEIEEVRKHIKPS